MEDRGWLRWSDHKCRSGPSIDRRPCIPSVGRLGPAGAGGPATPTHTYTYTTDTSDNNNIHTYIMPPKKTAEEQLPAAPAERGAGQRGDLPRERRHPDRQVPRELPAGALGVGVEDTQWTGGRAPLIDRLKSASHIRHETGSLEPTPPAPPNQSTRTTAICARAGSRRSTPSCFASRRPRARSPRSCTRYVGALCMRIHPAGPPSC